LFDGAHNVAGASALRAYLDSFEKRQLTLVFGAMADKNLEQMATILFPRAERLVLAQPANPRAATIDTLRALTRLTRDATEVFIADSPDTAIDIAQKQTPDEALICVTGSLYLIGDIQAALMRPKVQSRGN
jgi:dihydrofolate synthase/folylpolyglutamate synthase